MTDIHLPDTSGRILAAQLCQDRPGLRVLYISGIDEVRSAEAGEAPAAFLRKPFNAKQLLAAVAELLARG